MHESSTVVQHSSELAHPSLAPASPIQRSARGNGCASPDAAAWAACETSSSVLLVKGLVGAEAATDARFQDMWHLQDLGLIDFLATGLVGLTLGNGCLVRAQSSGFASAAFCHPVVRPAFVTRLYVQVLCT